jgi:hypothetical protein
MHDLRRNDHEHDRAQHAERGARRLAGYIVRGVGEREVVRMAQQMCRHQGCTCSAKGDGYCSEYCAGHVAGDDDEGHPCACGHDDCQAPTKFESRAAITDLAPGGRFIGEHTRDW